MTQLRTVTCHMGSHSVTCYPTQVNTLRLNPSHAGRYSIYLPRRDGRLSLPSNLSITSPTLNKCNQIDWGHSIERLEVVEGCGSVRLLHGGGGVISQSHFTSNAHEFRQQICRTARHTRLPTIWHGHFLDAADRRPPPSLPVVHRHRADLADGFTWTLRRCVGSLGHLVVSRGRLGFSNTELHARIWLDVDNIFLGRQLLANEQKHHIDSVQYKRQYNCNK